MNSVGKTVHTHVKEKLDPFLTTHKILTQKELNLRPKTTKTPRIKHREKASGYWIWQ